jgi:toxin ParE1/3/4
MRFEFHPLALEEYTAAAKHYAEVQPGLEARFISCVEDAIRRLCESPLRCRVWEDDVRGCLTHVFPYVVLYTIESDYDSDRRRHALPSRTRLLARASGVVPGGRFTGTATTTPPTVATAWRHPESYQGRRMCTSLPWVQPNPMRRPCCLSQRTPGPSAVPSCHSERSEESLSSSRKLRTD